MIYNDESLVSRLHGVELVTDLMEKLKGGDLYRSIGSIISGGPYRGTEILYAENDDLIMILNCEMIADRLKINLFNVTKERKFYVSLSDPRQFYQWFIKSDDDSE